MNCLGDLACQGAVRVDFVVVGKPGSQRREDGLGIGAVADAGIIALEGPDERLGHTVLCGLSIGVVFGMSRAKALVSRAT